MPTEPIEVVALLDRATFGPFPDQVDTLVASTRDELVSELIAPSPGGPFVAATTAVPDGLGSDGDGLATWWLNRMRVPHQSAHERMVWFWHSHFTSSIDKCSPRALAIQHQTIRTHALGNFRTLVRAMVTDPAVLQYLDGDGSQGSNPNENLSRELMELFTIGPGNYTEADVRAGARALAGWWVDWDTGGVEFEPESAYPGMVAFLGHRGRFGSDEIADALCDHPQCARHIAAKLFVAMVGGPPPDDTLDHLAGVFRGADLDIGPLLRAVLSTDEFVGAGPRPRPALEWFVRTLAVLDVGESPVEHLWLLEGLDQVPFRPPNVAGWSDGERWLAPSQALARTRIVLELADAPDPGFPEHDPITSALRHCAVLEPGPTTRAALDEAFWAPLTAPEVDRLLLYLLVNSPEFALS